MMGNFADEFINLVLNPAPIFPDYIDDSITLSEKTPAKQVAEESEFINLYTKIASKVFNSTEEEAIKQAIKTFKLARINSEAYLSRKDLLVLSNFVNDSLNYVAETLQNRDKTSLTKELKDTLIRCQQSLFNKEKVVEYLSDNSPLVHNGHVETYNELPSYWEDTISSSVYTKKIHESFKIKIDRLIVDLSNSVVYEVSFKTTGYALSLYGGRYGDFYKRKHYRQAAFYREGIFRFLEQTYGSREFEIKHIAIVVETTNQFNCGVFEIPEEAIIKGMNEVNSNIDRIAFHSISGNWSDTMEEQLHNGYMLIETIYN
jgi:hypothetical protein